MIKYLYILEGGLYMILQESGEMYLESIARLKESKGYVRAVDVCEYMGFSKPSVSRAMGLLADGGYITVTRENGIELTDLGKATAQKIYERHLLLTSFLKSIGVSDEIAGEDACKIEHVISDETFNKLKEYFNK
jgi:Mn-dependent DtxR family transcriptional regulator